MKPDKLIDQLNSYVTSNSDYIFSINGKSGIGKTYFIREYVSTMEEMLEAKFYSLDNFSSISELEESFKELKEAIINNVLGVKSAVEKLYIFDNVDGFINGCNARGCSESEIIKFFALARELNKNNSVVYLVDETQINSEIYEQYKEKYVEYQYELESHKEQVVEKILANKQLKIEISVLLDALVDIKEENLRYIIDGTNKFVELMNNELVYNMIKGSSEAMKLLYKNILFNVIESRINSVYLIEHIKNNWKINTTNILKEEYTANDASANSSSETETAKLKSQNRSDLDSICDKYLNTPIIVSAFVKEYLSNNFEINTDYLKEYIDLIFVTVDKIDLAAKLNDASNVDIYYMLDEDYNNVLNKWNDIFENKTLNFENILNIENLLLTFNSESELYLQTKDRVSTIFTEKYNNLFENQRLDDQISNLLYFADVYRFKYNTYFENKLEIDVKMERRNKYNDLYKKYFNERFSEKLQNSELHVLLKEIAFSARRDFLGNELEIFTDIINDYVTRTLNEADFRKLHYETIYMLDSELVTIKIQDDYFKELYEQTKKLEVEESQVKLYSWIVRNIDKWRAERVRRLEEKNRK